MNIKLFFYSLCFAMVSLLMASCSSSTDELVINNEEEFIKVPIGFSGEILNIEESPLTKTNTAKDWYAFQVYSAGLNEEHPQYKNYAYGFFDNKEDMIINLKKGYKYKFDVQMIKEASEKVYYFSLANAGWTGIGNSFFISSEEHVRYMYEGLLYLRNPNETFNRPNIDRFFGRTEDFIPEKDKSVNINMKRVSFGVKFVPQLFTEGKLEISIEGAPMIYMDSISDKNVQHIISFNRLGQAFSSTEEYSESIPVNIVWLKPDNSRVPIASQSVSFKRNKLTTITFDVNYSEKHTFEISASEIMQNGDTIEIGEYGTNHNVNP